MSSAASGMAASPKLVIAHRGASGYLPEHSLEAKVLAYGMGADYLEQDVVLTKDDRLIVLHDIHLESVTDVAARFPGRARRDGHYYALDFSLAEIQSLALHERVNVKTGKPVYPRRFPKNRGRFHIPSLDEEIELIQGLNQSCGRNVGMFLEIKKPAWHRQEGRDITKIVLETLKKFGYDSRDDAVVVQCFDAPEVKRIRTDLGCRLRLCQLIGENDWADANSDFDAMRTREGLRQIARYADAIGPRIEHIVLRRDDEERIVFSDLVDLAHRAGLKVYPYTLRVDDLPKPFESFKDMMDVVIRRANVDGAFTDFPDRMARFLKRP